MAIFPRTKKSDQSKQDEAPKTDSRKRRSRVGRGEAVAYRVLLRPHVTEKAGRLSSLNQYVFQVRQSATKPEIKQAIFETYGIRPTRVSTVRIPRKRRRLGKSEGWVPGYKKAMITLPEGKSIDVLPK